MRAEMCDFLGEMAHQSGQLSQLAHQFRGVTGCDPHAVGA
jgi:hypothetical protein